MTIALRQSTASQEVPLGHFVDSTDGVTAETGLTIANTDIKIWKSGATTLANKNSGGATHISGGVYYAVLDATDTNTVGPLVIFCAVSGALAVRLECHVYEEEVYDDLFAASAVGYLKPAVAGRDLDVTASGGVQSVEDVSTVASAAVSSVASGAIVRDSFAAETGLQSIRSNTAQAGASGTITLDASASAVDDFYNDCIILITSSTGVGQARVITDYVGSTKVATIAPNWATNPGATSTFAILPSNGALRPTVTGRTLDVTATGAAGIDWANIENPTTTVDLANTSINTVQTVVDVTGEVIWNPAWDAEIQSEVQDALEANNLDHLAGTATEIPAVVSGTYLDQLMDDGTASYDRTTDSLQAIRDRGDAAWTGGGGGTSDWTADERTAIRTILGVPTSGTTPEVPSAGAIKVIDDFLDTEIADIQARLPAALTAGGNIKADALAISGDTVAADNAEAFFDGTGYAGTGNTIPTVTSVTNVVSANVTHISGDSTAADNLESATDGTGYNIGNGSVVAASVTGNVGGNVTGSVGSVTGSVGSVASGGITAASIATGAIDADALAADAVDEILDEVVESTVTVRQALRLLISMMNKTSRSGSTLYFRDVADTKNRLAITIDSNADRTAVTRDLT